VVMVVVGAARRARVEIMVAWLSGGGIKSVGFMWWEREGMGRGEVVG
jgi:hypothetical protein